MLWVVIRTIDDLLRPDLLVLKLASLLFGVPHVGFDPLVNLHITIEHNAFFCLKLEKRVLGWLRKSKSTLGKHKLVPVFLLSVVFVLVRAVELLVDDVLDHRQVEVFALIVEG